MNFMYGKYGYITDTMEYHGSWNMCVNRMSGNPLISVQNPYLIIIIPNILGSIIPN